MLAEEQVPLEDRYLSIEGVLSGKALAGVHSGLPNQRPARNFVCFVGYAYADLPLGKAFDVAFPPGLPEQAVPCSCRLEAVTQQFSKPFDELPHGWKTVCLFAFDDAVPAVVLQLPQLEGWTFKPVLSLASNEVQRAMLSVAKQKPGLAGSS